MRLSEAIRLGSMLHPQGFDALWFEGRTCALGAAYMAMGFQPDAVAVPTAHHAFPALLIPVYACPSCYSRRLVINVADTITHLNDYHKWTREQIADWVQMIEPPAPAQEVGEPSHDDAVATAVATAVAAPQAVHSR